MSLAALTVNEMEDLVRQNLDEFNTENIEDTHIHNALNVGLRAASNVVSRKADFMMLYPYTFTTVADTYLYDFPTDIYAKRIEFLEVVKNDHIYPMVEKEPRTTTYSRSGTSDYLPYTYFLQYDGIYIPNPEGSLTVRVWYYRRPAKFVISQGRITTSDTTDNYFIVNSIGSDITTVATNLNNYINVVDYKTGEIKVTLQVNSTVSASERINVKTSPDRSTVLGMTVASAIPSTVAVDDLVCTIHGTCVCQFPESYVDFIIQHATVNILRRLGLPSNEAYAALKEYEKELKLMNSGRNKVRKVRMKSRSTESRLRRFWNYSN